MFETNDVSPEVLEKARQCKTSEELFALAKSEGIELSDEVLGEISGGNEWNTHMHCVQCSQLCEEYVCTILSL